MTIDELLNSFMSLNDDDRTVFLERAHEAAGTLPFHQDWLSELEDRATEVDAGRMPVFDWEEARQRIHEKHLPDA